MPVALVCGPPCGGKTTYVRGLARPGDVILDLDDICREVGGSHRWAHSQTTLDAAEQVMRQRIALLSNHDGGAFVIRCAPDPAVRMAFAAHLHAAVTVIDPGLAVCLARARTRPRGTTQVIRSWYRRYTPAPCDTYPAAVGKLT